MGYEVVKTKKEILFTLLREAFLIPAACIGHSHRWIPVASTVSAICFESVVLLLVS